MSGSSESMYSVESIIDHIFNNIDAAYVVDIKANTYSALKSNTMFYELFGTNGDYKDMVKKLLFHLSSNGKEVSEKYQVFTETFGNLKGKLKRKVNVFYRDQSVPVFMSSYQLRDDNHFVVILDKVDEANAILEQYTREKEETIKGTYLFTMLVDLTNDMCHSVTVPELSDKPVYAQDLKYSQWVKMIVNTIHEDDQNTFIRYTDPEYIKNHLNHGRCMSFDCQMRNLEDKFIWVKLIFNKVETLHDERFRFVFMVQDIHESSIRLIEDLKRYEELSNIDSLTGVFNHGKIENEFYKLMSYHISSHYSLSLIMIDIDYFKDVNDTYGHAIGDYVLKTMASISAEFLKSKNFFIGRWGGEEFFAIGTGITADEAYQTAEELRKLISEYDFDKVGHITCSFGVIGVSENDTTESAFERLDKALYSAKEAGRNKVVLN